MILKTELLPHQAAAVEKLSKIKIGALYMEMGTGKTRTALELIKRRLDAGKVEHVLWLCPCSVKQNLLSDIEKHSDLVAGPLTICGIETLSSSIREFKKLYQLVQENKTYLIVDESLLVKNPYAIRSRNITSISDQCEYKLILNGTPISKCEADLFSQWYILDWRILGYRSFWSFAANHLEYDEKYKGKVRRVLNVDYLTDKIAPYTYQVKKEECLKLPGKKEKTDYFSLTGEQDEHYYEIVDEFLSESVLDTDYEETAVYRALNALQQVTSGRRITSSVLEPIEHQPFFSDPTENPRIKKLLESIEKYLEPEEKAVIWCKFTHEIEDITTVLKSKGYELARFYGDLPLKARQTELERFRYDAQFLIANKSCAGFGLNLQFCHNAIYYSNDWNWATRAQSEDRLHRLGQAHDVFILDICANSKIDERIMRCLWRKENLSDEFKRRIGKKNLVAWLDGKDDEDDPDRAEPETKTRRNIKVYRGA